MGYSFLLVAVVNGDHTFPRTVCGPFLLGVSMTFLSLFSLFGLSGVVINTSFLLGRSIAMHKQQTWHEAIITACGRRMRAIVLTSITTVLGLLPLLFSHSFSVVFKPMVISILFGMLFSSMIAIVLIPVCWQSFLTMDQTWHLT